MTAALSCRWAGRLACCQSQPPQPPGRACGQGGGTRSAEGSRISTASARASLAVTWVTSGANPLPGQGVPDKYHRAPAIRAGDAPAAVHRLAYSQFQHVTGQGAGQGGSGHWHHVAVLVRQRLARGGTAASTGPHVGIP